MNIYQLNIINSKEHFTIAQTGAKVGKTFSHSIWTAIKAKQVKPDKAR